MMSFFCVENFQTTKNFPQKTIKSDKEISFKTFLHSALKDF
jgi:hypothetical protein